MAKIEDGKGNGYLAAVDSTNRLEVHAATVDEERVATVEGEAWQIGSAIVSFTAATESAILYVKNTGDGDLIVDRLRLHLGTVTGGTGDWTLGIIRNPTAGTIISTATVATPTNINHGSSKEPTGVFYRGVQGATFTDGTAAAFPIKSTGEGIIIFPFGRILPTGSSIGIRLTPPTGTTAANAIAVLRVYYPQAE